MFLALIMIESRILSAERLAYDKDHTEAANRAPSEGCAIQANIVSNSLRW